MMAVEVYFKAGTVLSFLVPVTITLADFVALVKSKNPAPVTGYRLLTKKDR